MKNQHAQALGRLGGRAAVEKRTHAEYVEQGRKGALKRWAAKKQGVSIKKAEDNLN